MSINVKVLKDAGGFKAGQVLSLRDATAKSLIAKKVAELRGSAARQKPKNEAAKKKARKR